MSSVMRFEAVLLVKACLSGLTQVPLVWGDCRWHICSLSAQSAGRSSRVQYCETGDDWGRLDDTLWQERKKKRVSNGLSCQVFSGSVSLPLASGCRSTCIIYCIFTRMTTSSSSNASQCRTLHSPMHNLGGWLMCVLAAFSILRTKSYCKVKFGVRVKNKSATALVNQKSFCLLFFHIAIFQTD